MSGEPKTLTLRATLTYDAEAMHSGDKDPESRDWFMREVLHGGNLTVHDNGDIGDTIGALSGVEIVARDEAAELRAAAIAWWHAMCDYLYVPTADHEALNQRLFAAEKHLAGVVKDLAATEGEA